MYLKTYPTNQIEEDDNKSASASNDNEAPVVFEKSDRSAFGVHNVEVLAVPNEIVVTCRLTQLQGSKHNQM